MNLRFLQAVLLWFIISTIRLNRDDRPRFTPHESYSSPSERTAGSCDSAVSAASRRRVPGAAAWHKSSPARVAHQHVACRRGQVYHSTKVSRHRLLGPPVISALLPFFGGGSPY